MKNDYEQFEALIDFYLGDKNATITKCELCEKSGSIYVLVHHIITNEYKELNNLRCQNRTLEILLKRGESNEGSPISSYARI